MSIRTPKWFLYDSLYGTMVWFLHSMVWFYITVSMVLRMAWFLYNSLYGTMIWFSYNSLYGTMVRTLLYIEYSLLAAGGARAGPDALVVKTSRTVKFPVQVGSTTGIRLGS